jgi:hypothetical protein
MSYKGETEPLITHTAVPERRPGWSRLRFYLALGLCFVLLTGSWHAFSWVSVNPSRFTADDSVLTGTVVRTGRRVVVDLGSRNMVLGVSHLKRELL